MPTWNESEKQRIQGLLDTAKITKDLSWYKKAVVSKIVANKARYKAMAELFKCPLAFIPLIHCKESASDLGKFLTYIGNGQPLNKVTTIVPKGRGPFKTWEAGAIDALNLKKIAEITDWSLARMFYILEGYNGYGYRSKGVNSPYIWNYTNHYTKGHYVADGKYDPNAVAGNIGCVALYMLLLEADEEFAFSYKKPQPEPILDPKIEEPPPVYEEVPTPKWFDPFKALIIKFLDMLFGEKRDGRAE